MEIFESVGYIHYWGLSPSLDLLKTIKQKNQKEYNILLTGTSDIRHILKTCVDNCDDPNLKDIKLNIYIHEKQKEGFCRTLILLLILHCTTLNYREREELFLDIFGNSLIRQKSADYIDKQINELKLLITDDQKHKTPLKSLLDFSLIKYKEIDEIVDILSSWNSKIPFNLQELRDKRLRYHYKERYDYRLNLIDWDYNMGMKDLAPIIHQTQYRDWRQTGVGFEQRFSTYIIPNRTLSSYLPGRKKDSKESCLVRGYWGDIIISPFIAFGVETDYEPEKTELFKIVNMQQISHTEAVAEFQIQYFIQKLETLTEFRAELYDPYGERKQLQKPNDSQKKENENKDKLEEIKEEEEHDHEQEHEHEMKEAKEEEKLLTEEQIMEQEQQEKEKLTQQEKEQIEKIKQKHAIPYQDDLQYSDLQGFKNLNLKIIPIFEDLTKIASRSKFQNKFDVVVLGFIHSGFVVNEDFYKLFNKQSELFVERSKFLIPLRKEEKIDVDKKLLDSSLAAKISNIKQDEQFEKISHHYKFIVNQ